jgi:hypothetical protein
MGDRVFGKRQGVFYLVAEMGKESMGSKALGASSYSRSVVPLSIMSQCGLAFYRFATR